MIKNASKIATIVLLIAISFGVIYSPSNVQKEELPMLASPLGDLENYELVVNCDLEKTYDPVTMAWIHKVPLEQEDAIKLAECFGLSNPESVQLSESTNLLRIRQGDFEVTFYDKNNILYREKGIEPVVKDYSDEKMIEIANDFLNRILETWDIKTDVSISLEKVAPYWTSTFVYLDGTENTVTRGIGVRYRLYLDGTKLDGAGTEVTIVIAEDRVIAADLHLPSIMKGGKKELTVSIKDALDTMIKRETEKTRNVYGDSEKTSGILVIDEIEPVYYWHHQEQFPTTLPIYYKIIGKVIYELDGQTSTTNFSVYEYTTP